MIKKMVVGGLLLVGASTFIFGRDAASYLKTAGTELRQSVKQQVPLEFEVRHAEQLVKDLVPEIRNAMHVIAEQQVEVESLEKAVAKREVALGEQRQAILALRTSLDQGDTQYVIAGKSYSQQQVEKDLQDRFRRFKMSEETLSHERDILDARRNALRSNEEQLATLISSKKELEAQLAQLDARMRAVEAAESVSDVRHLDDSRLSRAKSLIADLNKQLDVKERLLETDFSGSGAIPIEQELKPQVDISAEVDEYFKDDIADQPL